MNPSSSQAASQRYHPIFGSSPEHPSSSQRQLARTQSGASASRPPQRPLSMHNGARPRLPQTTQRARIPSSQRPQASGDSVIDAITLDSSSEDEARPVVRNIAPSTGSTQRPRPSSSRPPVPRRSSVRPVVSATASDDEIVFEREIPAPQRSTTRAPASASQARPSPAMPAASQAGPSRLPVSGSHEARGRADKGEGQPVGTSRQEIPTSSKEDGSAGPPRSGGMASAERFTGRSLVVPDSTPPTSHTSKEGYAPSQAAAGPSAQRPPVRLLVVSNSASSASSTPRAASSPEKQSSPQRQIQRSGAAPAGVPGGGGGFGRPSDSIPRGMLATTSRPTTPSAHGMERTLSFRLGNGSTASERRQALMDPSVRPSGSNISPMRMPKGEPSPSPLKRQKLASDSRSHTTQASPTKRFDRATNIASTASSRPHANSHRPASARSAQIPYTPLSGTLSNLSSTSSQSDTAASARSQSRQEQLDAIRARSKKAAEAAYPLSDVSVSLSPSQKKRRREEKYGSDKKPKNKDKKDRKDKVKAMLEAGPSGSGSGATSGSRTPSESSGAAAKAFAASPLKQTTKRMSSPVVQHGEQEADEESDPLDARNRSEGARSGVDLVEEMRKSSPSYMNAEEDAQAAQAGDGAAGTQAVAEQVSDPNKDVEEEEIDLLAMWDHLADIVVSPPTPPPAPSPLPTHSEPERALMRASTPDPKLPTMPPTSIQPATPNRPTARMDPYKTFSAIGEVSPAAARFKRHASLSPNVSMSQLPRTRGLSLSKADGSISSIASALVSATQRTADDPTLKTLLKQGSEQDKSTPPVSAPKKRTLADIMREQEEEEADLQRRHERALDWDEEEEEESDSGAESGTQNDEVPASGSMEDTESGGSRLMKVDGQIRRTSGRLRGMPSVALTALREDDDVTAARTEHSSATQAVATAEPVLPDYVPPNAEDAQLPDATADAMAANALDPVSEQAGLDAVAGLLEGGEDAPVAADVLREIATSTDQLDKAWEGLWADKEWKCSGVSVDRELAVPDLEGCGWLLPLLQLASAGNIRPLLTVLATGACTEVLDAQDGVGPCDMLQYVIDIALSGAAISEFAFSTALSMIKTANTNPFASSRGLIGKVSYTLGTLGLRPEMQSIFPRHECPDDACDAGCGWRIRYRTKGVGMMAMIVAVSAEVRWIEAAHAVQLAKLFLFLCIDPSTCTASCVSLQEALHQLWPLCLEDMAAPGLAIFICEHARHLPHLAQRDLLSAIGSASSQALEIARWTGIELLLPRSLEKLPSHTIHVVPHLNMIIDGTTAILENVVDRECDTDHGLLATQIEAFCAAMNDLQHMVTVHPGKTSNVERGFRLVVKHLKQACDAIRRGPSTGRLELYNKLRLSQLASIIDQQLERPLAKRSRAAQQAKLKKKGLVLGDASKGANQTRLDFVKLPMTRGDQWVAGGRDSGDETRGQEGAGHGEPAGEGEGRSPGDVDVGTAAADPAKGLATPTTANNKAAPSNVETNSLRMSEQPPAIPPTHTLPSPAASNPSTPAATQDQYITPSASPEPSPPPSAIVTPANDVLAETYDGVTREAITDTGRPTCTSPLNNRRSNDPSKPIPSASPERRQRSLSASIGHKVADAAKYVARKAGMGRLLTPPTEEQMASIPGSPAGAQAGQAEAGAAEASGAGSGGGGGGGDGGAGAGKTLRIPPTMKPRQRVPSDLLPSFGSAVPAGPLSASSTVKWGFGPRM